jgi:two-component system CheB/CheR fusion protein
VRTADSAAAAIKRIEERYPDVVLTDIAMPIADGYDLLRSIRESKTGNGMTVVALTAFGAVDPSRAGKFDAFLKKPIEPGELVETILRVRNGA